MTDLKFERVRRIARPQLISDLESGNPQTVADALYSAARYEQDTNCVQDQCLIKLTSPEAAIRWAAATCLGDLAFLRRPIDAKTVILALEKAKEDPAIADPAAYSLAVVKEFLGR